MRLARRSILPRSTRTPLFINGFFWRAPPGPPLARLLQIAAMERTCCRSAARDGELSHPVTPCDHLSFDIATYEVMCATPGRAVRRTAWKVS